VKVCKMANFVSMFLSQIFMPTSSTDTVSIEHRNIDTYSASYVPSTENQGRMDNGHPPNFFFASLVGLKSRRFYCCCSFTSFKRFFNTFQSFLKLFYTFLGPLVYLKNIPILLKNFATIGSGSFLSAIWI
jgi:hypothetical protein